MSIKRITAIVPISSLTALEKNLRACGVPGVTVEQVQGYGEHPNFFRRDLMKDNVRVVLYTGEDRMDDIVAAVCRCAKECGYSGLLAIETIDRLVKLPVGTDVGTSELNEEGGPQ